MLTASDLAEIIGTQITEIKINPGSVALEFGGTGRTGGWILIQCDFLLINADEGINGDAGCPESSTCLQRSVKRTVADANFDEHRVLTLTFEAGSMLKIIPKRDGFESYVLHTSQGIVPIIAV
ncbi:hypothetical protein PI87_27715 [Ralstonia sp. A12]|nr:hypothetical protein PI87_27715 [Ralstonia sp. A12]